MVVLLVVRLPELVLDPLAVQAPRDVVLLVSLAHRLFAVMLVPEVRSGPRVLLLPPLRPFARLIRDLPRQGVGFKATVVASAFVLLLVVRRLVVQLVAAVYRPVAWRDLLAPLQTPLAQVSCLVRCHVQEPCPLLTDDEEAHLTGRQSLLFGLRTRLLLLPRWVAARLRAGIAVHWE